MIGIVDFWRPESSFGLIKGQDGGSYFASGVQVRRDEYCRRFLEEGEEVKFEAGKKLSAKQKPPAMNIVPVRLEKILETPADYRAEWEVVKFFTPGRAGLATRVGTRDYVFWKKSQIISQMPSDFQIGLGTLFWAGLMRSTEDPDRFSLREIEIVIPETKLASRTSP